jgi:hypothetical protein
VGAGAVGLQYKSKIIDMARWIKPPSWKAAIFVRPRIVIEKENNFLARSFTVFVLRSAVTV